MCASAGGVITPAFQPVECVAVQHSLYPPENCGNSVVSAQRLQARAPPILF
jgi:hypothetical protein